VCGSPEARFGTDPKPGELAESLSEFCVLAELFCHVNNTGLNV